MFGIENYSDKDFWASHFIWLISDIKEAISQQKINSTQLKQQLIELQSLVGKNTLALSVYVAGIKELSEFVCTSPNHKQYLITITASQKIFADKLRKNNVFALENLAVEIECSFNSLLKGSSEWENVKKILAIYKNFLDDNFYKDFKNKIFGFIVEFEKIILRNGKRIIYDQAILGKIKKLIHQLNLCIVNQSNLKLILQGAPVEYSEANQSIEKSSDNKPALYYLLSFIKDASLFALAHPIGIISTFISFQFASVAALRTQSSMEAVTLQATKQETISSYQWLVAKLSKPNKTEQPSVLRRQMYSEFPIVADESANYGDFTDPAVLHLSNNNSVVLWSSNRYGLAYEVYGRIFDRNQTSISNVFRVNSYTIDDQRYSAVAQSTNSNFMVVWQSNGQDGALGGIYIQLYSAAGTQIGSERRINTTTASDQAFPAITSTSDGGYILLWQSYGQDSSGYAIVFQRLDSSGNLMGGEIIINTTTLSEQSFPQIFPLKNGNYIVIWNSYQQDGSDWGVYGQIIDTSGNKIGGEFQVNTFTSNGQQNPKVVCLENGNFVVVWSSYAQNGATWEIHGQLFDPQGTKINSEFFVNTDTSLTSQFPSIAAISDKFVVLWQDGDIRGQVFDSQGNKLGDTFIVNLEQGTEAFPVITSLEDNGSFLAVWFNSAGANGPGFYGRRFNINVVTQSTTASATTNSVTTDSATTDGMTSASMTTNNMTTASLTSDSMTSAAQTSDVVTQQPATTEGTTDAASVESTVSAENNQNTVLIASVVGGGAVIISIAVGTAIYLGKRYKTPTVNPDMSSVEMFDKSANLEHRQDKNLTLITCKNGRKFYLVNKINRVDAESLYKQTGYHVNFLENENKKKFILDEGQFGKVRLALDEDNKLFAVVKKVKTKQKIAASKNEALLLEKLNGKPNIIPVLGYATDLVDSNGNPVLYSFMHFAAFGNGFKLQLCLHKVHDDVLKLQLLLHLFKCIATGLTHTHAKGIYHLDLKPANILLDTDGTAYLGDFNCAVEHKTAMVQENFTGSLYYFSPERLAFLRGDVTNYNLEKCDAWALGILLLEIFTNQYPFNKVSEEASSTEIEQMKSEIINQWNEHYFTGKLTNFFMQLKLPDELKSIIQGLLEIDPAKRITATQALTSLNSINSIEQLSKDTLKNKFDELQELSKQADVQDKFKGLDKVEEVDHYLLFSTDNVLTLESSNN